MLAARIELVQQMPIFGAIDAAAIEFLLEPAPVIEMAAGRYFFREGDMADCMYVLERGSVTIMKNWGDRLLLLRRLSRGDCFGEMALLDLFPRSASIRADEDCSAICITPDNLLRLFEHDATQFALIQMNIGRELSRRLRATDDLLFRARMGEALEAPQTLAAPSAAS
ncbi:Crp/Fnr family transcriptional regulator [Variovorax sp. KK3]|uniref:Crp/Fnr family transcriptional regulator n=1 Tax=Variovorax sp. KK3 TaxID=1855728 RepID=UPI00097C36A0|nr:cyclic nucleotide-binding domain-containing protein [Variovorax sp. KK3]